MSKLNFEIVPTSCWYNNLRHILSKRAWDYIRKDAYQKANGKCTICNAPKKRLEAHERWSYDMENGVQKLEDIIAVCHDCHSVIHIGRTQLKGDVERAEKHFIRVNKCSYADYVKALGEANEFHRKLNAVPEWKLDLSYFKKYVNED
jgi:hypothetical protein